MDIIWHLDNEDFSGLASCDFDEVKQAFNYNGCFVRQDSMPAFVKEATAVKEDYASRLAEIDAYQVGAYEEKIRRGEDILFSDEPTYRVMMLETEVKGRLIGLMRKYFSRQTYAARKASIAQRSEPSDEATEDVPALQKALAQIRSQLYAFLSHVDYYMRHYGYFIRRRDAWLATKRYSEAVSRVNTSMLPGEYFYFLGSWGRPMRTYERYIDVDPISMEQLVLGMCQSNTRQLAELAGIFGRAIRSYHGPDAYERRCREMSDYIKDCEAKGLLRKVN